MNFFIVKKLSALYARKSHPNDKFCDIISHYQNNKAEEIK